MKRFAVRQWVILCVWVSLTGTALFAQQASAPPTEEHSAAQQDQKDQKDGTGVIPPGVKLLPQMPGPGAPTPYQFPSPCNIRIPITSLHSPLIMWCTAVRPMAGRSKEHRTR